MTRAEERALEHTAYCRNQSYKDYLKGFKQAEKDLALSWEDVPKLIELTGKTFRHYCDAGRPDVPLQELYEDVLRRFKEAKK